MQVTPASSTWPQLVLPQPEKLHWWMVSSLPVHATSSIQISPVPAHKQGQRQPFHPHFLILHVWIRFSSSFTNLRFWKCSVLSRSLGSTRKSGGNFSSIPQHFIQTRTTTTPHLGGLAVCWKNQQFTASAEPWWGEWGREGEGEGGGTERGRELIPAVTTGRMKHTNKKHARTLTWSVITVTGDDATPTAWS